MKKLILILLLCTTAHAEEDPHWSYAEDKFIHECIICAVYFDIQAEHSEQQAFAVLRDDAYKIIKHLTKNYPTKEQAKILRKTANLKEGNTYMLTNGLLTLDEFNDLYYAFCITSLDEPKKTLQKYLEFSLSHKPP